MVQREEVWPPLLPLELLWKEGLLSLITLLTMRGHPPMPLPQKGHPAGDAPEGEIEAATVAVTQTTATPPE